MTRARRQGIVLLAAGLLAVALVVGFFVAFAVHDDRTLDEGRTAPGTVTRLIPPQDWDWFDSGRIEVAYVLDGRRHRSTIWIDSELSDYHIGDAVNVYVRGSHVRTDEEPNDPQPLGFAAALVGLAGLGTAGWGGVRALSRDHAVPTEVTGRIPLKTWRMSPRKARIDIAPTELSLYLPAYFGPHRVAIPREGTVFSVQDHAGPEVEMAEDTYFKEAVLTAYFPTASVVRGPDLFLLTTRPVRIPVLRRTMALSNNVELPFSRGETRSEEGVSLDGIALRAAHPAQARHELAAAGLAETSDPDDWLVAHREHETDPAEIAEIQQEVVAGEHAASWSTWLFGAATAGLVASRFFEQLWVLVASGVLFALAFVLPPLVFRLRLRRARR